MKSEMRKSKFEGNPKLEIRSAAPGRGPGAGRTTKYTEHTKTNGPTPRGSFRISDLGFLISAFTAVWITSLCCLFPMLAQAASDFPSPSALPAQADLPNPLVMLDGRSVTNRAQWVAERRPELQALFLHYEYGAIPPKPEHLGFKVQATYPDYLGGQASLKLITIRTGPTNAPRIDLLLVVPNGRTRPAPVFLAMNFAGNHALTADPRVPLSHSWMSGSAKGCSNNVATDAARGLQAADWPLAEIVRRGYAVASFYSGDVDSDRASVSDGVYAWLAGGDAARNNPTNRGTIAAWAWGFHRCVDYLVKDADLDSRRIAALGHSRNGKATLLAAAFDERIAIAFPHQAGCGGTSPARGTVGETVKAINARFPHWFNGAFKEFGDAPERLPFDHNCLVALCAPRPVLFSCATGDQWSNPAGQFEVLRAADSVYRFLGERGIAAPQRPPVGQLVGDRLGYYIREGKHSMGPADWAVFLDFADKQFAGQ
jgi:hypothetical protein